MSVGSIREAGELELAGFLMFKNVNKLQNCEACLRLLTSKYLLTQVGMHYKSIQVAHIFKMTVASQ